MSTIHVQSIVDGILSNLNSSTPPSISYAKSNPTLRITSAAARADLISRLPMIENRLKEIGCYFSAMIDPSSIRLEFYPFSGTRIIIGLTHLEMEILSQYLTMARFRVKSKYDPRHQAYNLRIEAWNRD